MQNPTTVLTSPAIFSCRHTHQPRTVSLPLPASTLPRRAPQNPHFSPFLGIFFDFALKSHPETAKITPKQPIISLFFTIFLRFTPYFLHRFFPPRLPLSIAFLKTPPKHRSILPNISTAFSRNFSRCRAILVSEIAENRERCIFRPHFCAQNFIFERRKSPVFQRPFSRLVFSPVLPRNRTVRSGRRSPRKIHKKALYTAVFAVYRRKSNPRDFSLRPPLLRSFAPVTRRPAAHLFAPRSFTRTPKIADLL